MENSSRSRLFLIGLALVLGLFIIGYFASSRLLQVRPPISSPTVAISTIDTPVPLPPFPWPVPKPSALEVLTLESLEKTVGTGITFHDVDERISSALHSAGYDERSYFGVPGGFAVVTRLEKMDADGYPDYYDRWASSLAPISIVDFSLTKYLEALFGTPQGHYRVFVFIVSEETVVPSGTPIAQEEAQTWFIGGANRLPNQMEGLPYTREHTTTVYIYEFIQSGVGGEASYNIPSDFTGRQHLERARLWEYLNTPTTFFTEEFDQDPGWNHFLTRGDENQAQVEFSNSLMTFNLSGTDIYAYSLYENSTYRDVRLDMRAENRGDNHNEISLVCRYTKDGWYEFSVAGRGGWRLYAAVPGSSGITSYTVIQEGGAPTLKDGTEANEYSMICKDNEIRLYINDTEIQTIRESTYMFGEGYVGINISSFTNYPVIVEVDWFKISKP